VSDIASKRSLFSWCLYDWANSAYPTVITTFVFATYFTKAIAETPERGTGQLGLALGIGGVIVALTSPVLGAIADRVGTRKPWIAVFTALCVVATAMLWYAKPEPDYAVLALIFLVVSSVTFEFGGVFYNAMLPELAPPAMIGRISGWGWGLGYAGGLLCLVVALIGFVQTDTPWFGVGVTEAANIRATAVLAAVWFAVFALPLFFFSKDRPANDISVGTAIRDGITVLAQTAKTARNLSGIVRFLLARMIYTDGLSTLFAFGGVYAGNTFGMELAEVIQFGIALNVTAGLGAAMFAFIDDRIGAKRVIIIALVALIFFSSALLIVESKLLIWLLGLGLGIFVGPAQAASRSMMVRLAPEEMHAEMFGLFAFSGKVTAFLGPFVLGLVTVTFDSQRAGMATIVVFLLVGLLLLLPVKEPRS